MMLIFTILTVSVNAQKYTIDTNYPGGNVIISNYEITSTNYFQLDSDTVYVRPDLRDTPKFWFYWNFRVSGTGNRTLYFKFDRDFIGAFGPAVSTDSGKNWYWLYQEQNSNSTSFEYSFKEGEKIIFSQGIPYLENDFNEFVSPLLSHPFIKLETLTQSKKGRNIEKVLIQNPSIKPKFSVLVTARHHACEAMANYALEGIIRSILDENNPSSKWLRENVAFFIVPFVDKDGVEDGDQGKNQIPYDPLLDYTGESIYNAPKAIREQVPKWSENNLTMVLDLHCPGLRGKWAETIFVVGAEDETIANEQRKFVEILRNTSKGELKLHSERSLIEFGTGWNKPGEKTNLLGFREWGSEQTGNKLAVTFEFAYANNNGQIVTPENARLLGKDIANTITIYLQKLK